MILLHAQEVRLVPLVAVYDPDPIASLRKRRVSTDSHDSVTSHGHGEPRAGQEVAKVVPRLPPYSVLLLLQGLDQFR